MYIISDVYFHKTDGIIFIPFLALMYFVQLESSEFPLSISTEHRKEEASASPLIARYVFQLKLK